MSTTASPADDAFLDALFDTLIPPSASMPGAGTLGLARGVRAQLAAFGQPLEAEFTALANAAAERDPGGLPALDPDARTALVAAAMQRHPMLAMLPLLLSASYYAHPRVREALGQPPGPPFPKGHVIEATDEGLLRKLRTR